MERFGDAGQPSARASAARSTTTTSLAKKIVFACVPLLITGAILEVAARCYFFQVDGEETFAVTRAFRSIADSWQKERIQEAALELRERVALAERDGSRQGLVVQYEPIFDRFIEVCRGADARVIVVYVPPPSYVDALAIEMFTELTSKHGVPLLDLTETFRPLPLDLVYLMPEDGHLSRFGNAILARALREKLEPLLDHRSSVTFEQRAALLGDLRPDQNEIFWMAAPLPCRLITNSQGLLRKTDVAFPKTRVRVLCVGDSYTFGHAVHNPHCYPQLLEQANPEIEAINAGVAGYTICDQTSYFEERGRYLEPDIVVLQVMANDLEGFLPELQETYCRGGAYCPVKGKRR